MDDDPDNIRNTICVDFDKTIANNSDHPDYNILGPTDGAKNAMDTLRIAGKFIIIYSSRKRKYFWDVMDWLIKYQIPFDCLDMESKPLAEQYIDDKAVNFNGDWNETLSHVKL